MTNILFRMNCVRGIHTLTVLYNNYLVCRHCYVITRNGMNFYLPLVDFMKNLIDAETEKHDESLKIMEELIKNEDFSNIRKHLLRNL